MENITLVIRSVKERTEQLCKKLLLEQGIAEEDLHIVREVPFSESMRKSFLTGIEKEKKWTLCVDADILARPESVKKMVEHAESQKKNVCEIQGYIMDKFFGGIRRGGFHLYRTSLLPKVLNCIPSEGVDIRPESRTLMEMAKKGYPRAVVPFVVGIHDDEQYNFDIYRKGFVYAVKHLNHTDLLINHWKKNVDNDHDFNVALHAFANSILNKGDIYINSNQQLYRKKFEESGFEEKDELDISKISLGDIEERIQNWKVDEKYYEYYPDSQGLNSQTEVFSRKLKSSFKNRGIFQTGILLISQTLLTVGKKLSKFVPE